MRAAAALLLMATVAGCATPPQRGTPPSVRYWLPSAEAWEQAQDRGVRLARPDQSTVFLPGPVVRTLVTARRRIEEASGITAQLAVIDLPAPNALASTRNGTPFVALSIPWLAALGHDADAVATTLGHEYAHLKLGHSGQARREREQAAAAGTQIVGGLLNAFVPFSGNLAGMAITGVARGFTRDEERAADELGLAWAAQAGYSPCGRIRTMQVYRRAGTGGGFSFLSTHPGADERVAYARSVAQQRGLDCGS